MIRREEREVIDKKEITAILERCNTIRIGISNGDLPYVVPVSFGVYLSGDMPVIYFHCAKQGIKIDPLGERKPVFVEADIFF